MTVTISIHCSPGEQSTHMRRALAHFFRTSGLEVNLVNSFGHDASDEEWSTLVAQGNVKEESVQQEAWRTARI